MALVPAPAFPAPLDTVGTSGRQLQPTGLVGKFDPAIVPVGAYKNETTTVIVRLNEAPVSVTGGSAADLEQRQQSVKNAIAAQGGTVTMSYQNALNGFAVQTTRAKAAALATLPGVRSVKATRIHEVDNAQSVPYIGAPAAWDGAGANDFRGEGAKIGIIDTGIDYTHANFGGPGTVAAYDAANATDTAPADPTLFGPTARTKIKGGTDFVGDAYDADATLPNGAPDLAKRTPHPDPNPLDCNGHGSHVGGTAAGFGVTAAGATYTGPYDTTTHSRAFRIGPGVAPLADLYAIRVFGCDGSASSEVVIAGIEWAVDNHLDMVNMSLSSPFGIGDPDDPEIEAINNAVRAGLLIIASAGNEGPSPYIVGRPSTADRALSVAAVDSKATFPGAIMNLSTGRTINAINANDATLPGGSTPIIVLRDAGGNVSLGCDEDEYNTTAIVGKLVVTRRGVCAHVDRAIFADRHGAAAAAILNTDSNFPPFEGPIAGVDIPLLGIRGTLAVPTSDANALVAADGGSTTLAPTNLTNPAFRGLASFTSSGPRFDDSFLKPEVAAPGVSIISTGVGTGNGGAGLSGTSMAAPHVTGLAALVMQSKPSWWSAEDLKQAIVNTSKPGDVAGYSVRRAGAGLVNAPDATKTVAVAFGRSDKSTLSYGFDWDFHDMRETAMLLVRNHGPNPITFNLSTEAAQGRPHSISFVRTTLTVPAWGHASTNVTLNVPISSVGDSDIYGADQQPNGILRDIGGDVVLTPTAGGNGGVVLRVPYYLVAQALSNITDTITQQPTATQPGNVRVMNRPPGVIPGPADFYAWGLVADTGFSRDNNQPWDLRAAGVQSFDVGGGDRAVVWALNARGKYTNAAAYEYDILLENQAGEEFQVFSADFGAVTARATNGQAATFILDQQSGDLFADFFSFAPHNSNTILLPVLASTIHVTAAQPRFRYIAFAFNGLGDGMSVLPGEATFNAVNSTLSTGDLVFVSPGGTQNVPVTLNATEAAVTPAKGYMIVSFENNFERGREVELLPVPAAAPRAASGATAAAAKVGGGGTLASKINRVSTLKTVSDLEPQR